MTIQLYHQAMIRPHPTRLVSRALLVLVTAAPACRSERPAQVVFVCEHGAAKSVIAAAEFNRLAVERKLAIRAVARGADPQENPSETTQAGLRRDGLTSERQRPRRLTASDVRASARVVTFDCADPAMRALNGMDACWNGLVPEMLPECFDDTADQALKLWEISDTNAFIDLDFWDGEEQSEKEFSLNPYIVMEVKEYN